MPWNFSPWAAVKMALTGCFSIPQTPVFWYCLDTHWLQSGGKNPPDYIRKAKGRMSVVHFKDYKIVGGADPIEQVCKDFAEVGEGNLNWPAIIEACREVGVEAVIVEQDVCPRDPFRLPEDRLRQHGEVRPVSMLCTHRLSPCSRGFQRKGPTERVLFPLSNRFILNATSIKEANFPCHR